MLAAFRAAAGTRQTQTCRIPLPFADGETRSVRMSEGVICEDNTPAELFGHPQKQQTREFLSRFLAR